MAVLLAIGFVAGNFIGLVVAAAPAFVPVENQDRADDNLSVVLPAAIAFVLALLVLAGVAYGHWPFALAVLGAQFVLAAISLALALSISAHSDGKIIGLVFFTEIAGATAVLLTSPRSDGAREHREAVR